MEENIDNSYTTISLSSHGPLVTHEFANATEMGCLAEKLEGEYKKRQKVLSSARVKTWTCETWMCKVTRYCILIFIRGTYIYIS